MNQNYTTSYHHHHHHHHHYYYNSPPCLRVIGDHDAIIRLFQPFSIFRYGSDVVIFPGLKGIEVGGTLVRRREEERGGRKG